MIRVHENTKNHRESFMRWKEMERSLAEKRAVA